MLLEFTIENYKTFKDVTTFSMIPAPKQQEFKYSILEKKVGRKTHKALCSASIFGPNSSGKSNLIGAFETFRQIFLRGNILDSEDISLFPNIAASQLDFIPHVEDPERPVSFSIKFIHEGKLFDYSLSFVTSSFLVEEKKRYILSERLEVNEKMLFMRDKDDLKFGEDKTFLKHNKTFSNKKYDFLLTLFSSTMNKTDLIVNNALKMIMPDLVEKMQDWVKRKLQVIYRADVLRTSPDVSLPKGQGSFFPEELDLLRKELGISNRIGYINNKVTNRKELASFFPVPDTSGGLIRAYSAELIESYGIVRLFTLFPIIDKALREGKTLVIDEFDASLHPTILMTLVGTFHNPDINKYGAQLIFNTHNPILLHRSLLRRDEIKFVERDSETNESEIYSLADFKTGKNGVRSSDNYMNKYFEHEYGAVPDADFTSVFLSLVDKKVQK